MSIFSEKPLLLTLVLNVPAKSQSAYIEWQTKLNRHIVAAVGFVSIEFLHEQEECYAMQRFDTEDAIKAWRNSSTYKKFLMELDALNISYKESLEKETGATQFLITEVRPEKLEEFKEWSAKIHAAEAGFPGFRGVYVQSPNSHGRLWITLLQFDTRENLDRWLDSKERGDLINEVQPLIKNLESQRMVSPYGGWFSSIIKEGVVPALWKQTMLILLVLFPIVMLELRFLNPLLASLNPSLSTFIGNAISVSLISFPFLPLALKWLSWWLTGKHNFMGTVFVLILYLLQIALFWNIRLPG